MRRTRIETLNYIFRFKRRLNMTINTGPYRRVFIGCKVLACIGTGKSKDEAYTDLCEQLEVVYDGIVLEDDDKLTGDAIALKRQMLAVIKTVTRKEN